MKLATRTLLVALAVSALTAPGALAKPTPVSPAMFRSADAATRAPAPSGTSAVELERYYNERLAGLSPLQRSELRLSNPTPVVVATQAADGGASSFDWTLFGVLAIVGTGVAALTSLAYMLSRRVGGVAHP